MGEKKRGLQHISQYRTEIMGFAILWIVLFHSAIPAPESPLLRLIWYCVVSFGGGLGVNIFMLLSGYGLAFSHSKKSCCSDRAAIKDYFRRRMKRILIPYFFVAVIFFAVSSIHKGTGVLGFLEEITLLSFIMRGVRTYWYIFAIILLYCLFPLYMYLSQRFGYGRICVATVATLICLEMITCAVFPVFYQRFEVIILRAPLFFIGSYLGQLTIDGAQSKQSKRVFIGAIVVAVIAFLVYMLAFGKQVATLRLQRYLFIPMGIGIAIGLSLLFPIIPFLNKLWSVYGRYSLGVYLIHIPLYELVQNVGGYNWNPYFVFLCVMVASLLGAFALSWITDKIAKYI